MSNHNDYIEAGFKVFGLYGADSNGNCECGNPECQAAYKHPRVSNWQHTPYWSDEQLETMEEMGQFDTGYGVLCDGWLVIDVDPRNGGTLDSVRQWYDKSGFVVATGGGGWHIYYRIEPGSYLQHLDDYPGVDFKTSGFVVGAESLHQSGSSYEVEKGSPYNITMADEELINLLKRPDSYRAKSSGGAVDVSHDDIQDMLSYIDADCDYDTWIKCGMAIHDTTQGAGIELFDGWSKQGKKYPGFDKLQRHWHSFGKNQNGVSFGTLKYYAEQSGFVDSVEFESTEVFIDDTNEPPAVDLLRPPGFVGEVCRWINQQSFFPRERLAVAAALSAVSSVAGMRFTDDYHFTPNIFALCVAGSGTGKEAIQQSYADLLRASGVISALHGGIKSEQELIRNFIRHQAAYYAIDEFGLMLSKLVNSSGAAYLQGVIATLMSSFTKANGYLQVTGDIKDTIKGQLYAEINHYQSKIDSNEDPSGKYERKLERARESLVSIDSGIKNPYINLMGFTTPVTFNGLVSFELATNGFVNRSLIFNEHETNPRPNKHHNKHNVPDTIAIRLASLYNGGDVGHDSDRVESKARPTIIPTEHEAADKMTEVSEYFWQLGEEYKDYGLEAISRRGFELVGKVSLILAIPDGLRTLEHVTWAFELVKHDISEKTRLARANDIEKEDPKNSISVRIETILRGSDDGVTHGILLNRCRPHNKKQVETVIEQLIESGNIVQKTYKNDKGGRRSKKYFIK